MCILWLFPVRGTLSLLFWTKLIIILLAVLTPFWLRFYCYEVFFLRNPLISPQSKRIIDQTSAILMKSLSSYHLTFWVMWIKLVWKNTSSFLWVVRWDWYRVLLNYHKLELRDFGTGKINLLNSCWKYIVFHQRCGLVVRESVLWLGGWYNVTGEEVMWSAIWHFGMTIPTSMALSMLSLTYTIPLHGLHSLSCWKHFQFSCLLELFPDSFFL